MDGAVGENETDTAALVDVLAFGQTSNRGISVS